MAYKQLEFKLMKKDISKVTSLGYIGGQDEELGGYCEPLIIEYSDGMEQYVLHAMNQSTEIVDYRCGNPEFGKIINNHKRVIFPNRLRLMRAWREVGFHLTLDNKLNWEKTDAVCGCNASTEEFYKTKRNNIKEEAV